MCKSNAGLFQTVDEKFKSQYNETALQLQYCKLLRDCDESTKKWMGCLRTMAYECNYQECDR